MKTILLDVDEVLTFSGFLEVINEFLNMDYTIDDFTDYYIDRVCIPTDKIDEFEKFMETKNIYDPPHLLDDAIDVVKKLNEKYDVYIYSSCVNPLNKEGSGRMFADKYNFLVKYFPFLDPEHFIFTSVKKFFGADIQIDDRVNNFSDNIKMKILFPSYHNKDISDEELKKNNIVRAGLDYHNGWKEIEKILLK